MRASINWLKDFVDISMGPEELGERLTMAGLEVEGIEPMGHGLGGVITGRIIELSRHPKADRLFLCRVDVNATQATVFIRVGHGVGKRAFFLEFLLVPAKVNEILLQS